MLRANIYFTDVFQLINGDGITELTPCLNDSVDRDNGCWHDFPLEETIGHQGSLYWVFTPSYCWILNLIQVNHSTKHTGYEEPQLRDAATKTHCADPTTVFK